MAKVQISIDDDLLEKVDDLADKMYMSRSGFFSHAAASVVNQQLILMAIKDMSLAVRKIADKGEIDEESLAKLEDFERLSKMLTGQK